MSVVPDQPPAETAPDVAYTLFGLTALMAAFLALTAKTNSTWVSLVPILLGGAGLLLRWTSAAPLFLAALAWVLAAPVWASGRRGFLVPQSPNIGVAELILVGAALVYVGSLYRLLALTKQLFPSDAVARPAIPERVLWLSGRNSPSPGAAPWRRSAGSVDVQEFSRFFLGAALCVVGALLFLMAEQRLDDFLGLSSRIWQGIVLLWLLGAGFFVATQMIALLRWRRFTEFEARMVLEDETWQAGRGAFRFLERWGAWTEVRKQRREQS